MRRAAGWVLFLAELSRLRTCPGPASAWLLASMENQKSLQWQRGRRNISPPKMSVLLDLIRSRRHSSSGMLNWSFETTNRQTAYIPSDELCNRRNSWGRRAKFHMMKSKYLSVRNANCSEKSEEKRSNCSENPKYLQSKHSSPSPPFEFQLVCTKQKEKTTYELVASYNWLKVPIVPKIKKTMTKAYKIHLTPWHQLVLIALIRELSHRIQQHECTRVSGQTDKIKVYVVDILSLRKRFKKCQRQRDGEGWPCHVFMRRDNSYETWQPLSASSDHASFQLEYYLYSLRPMLRIYVNVLTIG